MNDLELVQASGLKPAVAALRRRGIDADHYLERNGIPPEFIELPYAPLPKRSRFWVFLDDVEQSEGIDTLGFLMGDEVDLTDVGPFGLQLTRAATLLDALKIAHHNVSNYAQENTIHLEREGDKAWILCESYRKTCRPADHGTLNFIIELVRLAAGPGWRPQEARLQTGPAEGLKSLPVLQDCKLEFHCDAAGVAVPDSLLSVALRTHDPDGVPAPENLTPLPRTGRLSDSLRVVIATFLPYRGPPTASEAADMVGVSRSTLFRRLEDEGVTYKGLVEDVRYQAAREFLANPRMSLKDIAYLLGYSVPNNFIRAFRKLAGITPNTFRRELLSE